MRYLLDAVYLVLVVVTSPFLFAAKSRRALWSRFLGRTGAARAGGTCVWFHGVSVGEIHLLRGVVQRFRARFPAARLVISSTTDTGFAEALRCFPDLEVIRWPLDFSWAVERALRAVRPALVVLAESELWPNFLLAARRRSIPVVAINVRLSPRSLRRYQRLRSLSRRWLGLVSHFAVQTEDYALALRRLGVDARRVSVTGSVKYDGVSGERTGARTEELRRLFGIGRDERVWVAGSTQAPEEQIVLDAYQRLRSYFPDLRLIIVPRQRERFDEVAALLTRSAAPFVRRSRLDAAQPLTTSAGRPIILLDTIGELNATWGLADIAFVGGSLDGRRGGQNMIEPAAYGAAVLFGPHTWNFRDTVERLLAADAAMVVGNPAELAGIVEQLLDDEAARRRFGEAALRLVQGQQGATTRTLAILGQWLESSTVNRAA